MNALTTLNTTNAHNVVKMSSQEIADLTGKKHFNVLRDIRTMLTELGDDSNLNHVEEVKDARGYTVYMRLPRREVEILLTGYSIPLRAKVIDRLHELERFHAQNHAPKLPTSFAEALRLAAELEEQKEQLRLQNEAMKPAATVGIAVSARKQTTIMDFARKLPGVNTMQVQNKLAELGHMRKRKNAWAVYAASKKYFTEGFDHKGFSIITRDFAILGNNFPVRIVELNGQPWFVAKDVCLAIGRAWCGSSLAPLNADEKGMTLVVTPGGSQHLTVISESGLYKLIMRSDKPQARLFQDWVTRDVLPAIRKDGAYIMGEYRKQKGLNRIEGFDSRAKTVKLC
ncbi:BRO family protein [Ectopseudomonas hydrolytica]|uniref:BRO family protein n=1 Tax=Ectopseudomonas hydrolytica TaxID=2493633 RepID=UPI0020B8A3CC|nr:BRO family protein [Pseudomonas hydrolytica]UTH29458.1 BRO family protein [Pseudomonas hydrolytica]